MQFYNVSHKFAQKIQVYAVVKYICTNPPPLDEVSCVNL